MKIGNSLINFIEKTLITEKTITSYDVVKYMKIEYDMFITKKEGANVLKNIYQIVGGKIIDFINIDYIDVYLFEKVYDRNYTRYTVKKKFTVNKFFKKYLEMIKTNKLTEKDFAKIRDLATDVFGPTGNTLVREIYDQMNIYLVENNDYQADEIYFERESMVSYPSKYTYIQEEVEDKDFGKRGYEKINLKHFDLIIQSIYEITLINVKINFDIVYTYIYNMHGVKIKENEFNHVMSMGTFEYNGILNTIRKVGQNMYRIERINKNNNINNSVPEQMEIIFPEAEIKKEKNITMKGEKVLNISSIFSNIIVKPLYNLTIIDKKKLTYNNFRNYVRSYIGNDYKFYNLPIKQIYEFISKYDGIVF